MKEKDLIAVYKFLKKFQTMSFKQQNVILNKFEKYIKKQEKINDK